MSLQIRTIVSGRHKYLDLFDDEDILMSFSFAEIQDITAKNSAYSKSFTIPGTKNNNDIFNYFYNLNSTPLDFDPNNKFDASLLWDGYEILFGNIRLDGVVIQREDFTYQVTFYNQVGNLAANIGDKFLRQTDLSHLSHPFTQEVISESNIDYNLFPLTATTNYSYQNGKTFWGLYNIGYEYTGNTNSVNFISTPLLEFAPISANTYTPQTGYFDFSGTPVQDFYFKPTLQIKELYTSIVRDAGYEIESDFFNTSYFERFYLPLKFLDDSVYSKNAIPACFRYESVIDSSGNTFPSTGITCNSLGYSAGTNSFVIQDAYAGIYTFRFSYNITPDGGDCIYDESGNWLGPQVEIFYVEGNEGLYQTNFCENETISFDRQFILTGESEFTFTFTAINAIASNFVFEIINPLRFIPSGSTIDYALEFPDNDYKQIDFITSINRYFNLVVVPSPNVPNTLIIEPIIDYIGKGRVLDWTTKVDNLQQKSITTTTSLVNGTLDFEFQLDQDYANQDFKTAANKIFGTDKINLNLEYKNSNIKFTYIFSSPIDITINPAPPAYLTLSSFSKIRTLDSSGQTLQQFVSFKILPRVVFRGATLPNDLYGFVDVDTYKYWYFEGYNDLYEEDRFNIINRYTTYPFSFSGFSHYTNFDGEDRSTITPPEFSFISPDLYDIYYKDYIEDLISPENKIFKCKIYLTPLEIKDLLYNEKILIDNSYFRINKIDNFNLLEPAICDLELVKLTKEYNPHRVLYYDLIPCSSGSTRYSNSDLNYNLYAYAGNYVKLYDDSLNYLGCHQVQIGTYNQNNNYQHYYIGSGYTPDLVGVYPDCSCTGRTAFNVVQEEIFNQELYLFIGQEVFGSRSIVFKTINPSLQQANTSYRITNGITEEEICVASINPTYIQDTPWILLEEYTGSTCNITPTPTPSLTSTPTMTPTPTNTETPTNTPTNTPTSTETPTQTPTPTNTETPTNTPTPTNTETPTQTPTNTGTPTNTPTPTRTSTPTPTITPTQTQFPICPEQLILSGSPANAIYSGTYDRLYSYTGGSFTTGYYQTFNNTWAFDVPDGSGRFGSIYGRQSGTTYFTIYNRITASGGSMGSYAVVTTTGSYGVNGALPGIGLNLGGAEVISNVLYPSRGFQGTSFYKSYPSVCPTPTPTPTMTTTPTQTPTNTITPTNTGTPTNTPTPSITSSPTQTPTNTPTPTNTETPTQTPTNTITPTNTGTPTQTPTNTITPTNTGTPTNTPTPTSTSTNFTALSLCTSNGSTGFASSTDVCNGTCTNITVYVSQAGITSFQEAAITYGLSLYTSTNFIPANKFNGGSLWFGSSTKDEIFQVDSDGAMSLFGVCPSPTPTSTNTPTPTSTPPNTPTQTPSNTPTISTTPSQTPTNTQTPTPSPLSQIYTHGAVRATCSDYCTTNYNITTLTTADNSYAALSIGDFIYGISGSGFIAYSDVSTDTTTGPFRIAEINSSGEVLSIQICVGGTCDPL